MYSTVDLVSSADYFVNDFKGLKENFNYYNLFFYEPIHFYTNVMATYE